MAFSASAPSTTGNQAVAIISVDPHNHTAKAMTRRRSVIDVDLRYHTGGIHVIPAVGEQWLVAKDDSSQHRLVSKLPGNAKELTSKTPQEGQVHVGSSGPLELNGNRINLNADVLSIGDGEYRNNAGNLERNLGTTADPNWQPISPGSTDHVTEGDDNLYYTDERAAGAAPVQSVQGRHGDISLTKDDLGLSHIDDTADADKPLSQEALEALLRKADLDENGMLVIDQLPIDDIDSISKSRDIFYQIAKIFGGEEVADYTDEVVENIAYWWEHLWNPVSGLPEVIDEIGKVFAGEDLGESAQLYHTVAYIKEWFDLLWRPVEAVPEILHLLGQIFSGQHVGESIHEIVNIFAEWFHGIWDEVKDGPEVFNEIAMIFSGGLLNPNFDITQQLNEWWHDFWKPVEENMGWVLDVVEGIGVIFSGEEVEGSGELPDVLNYVKGWFDHLWAPVADIPEILDLIGQIFSGQHVGESWSEIVNIFSNWFNDIWDDVKQGPAIFQELVDFLIGNLVNPNYDLTQQIKEFINDILSVFGVEIDDFDRPFRAIEKAVGNLIESILRPFGIDLDLHLGSDDGPLAILEHGFVTFLRALLAPFGVDIDSDADPIAALEEALGAFVSRLGGFLDDLASFGIALWNVIVDADHHPLSELTAAWHVVLADLEAFAPDAGQFWSGLSDLLFGSWTSPAFAGALGGLVAQFFSTALGQGTQQDLDDAWDATMTAVDDLSAGSFWKIGLTAVKLVSDLSNLVGTFFGVLGGANPAELSAAFTAVMDDLSLSTPDTTTLVADIVGQWFNPWHDLLADGGALIETFFDFLFGQSTQTQLTDAWDAFIANFSAQPISGDDLMGAAVDAWFPDWDELLTGLLTEPWQWIGEIATDVFDGLGKTFRDIEDFIQGGWDWIWGGWAQTNPEATKIPDRSFSDLFNIGSEQAKKAEEALHSAASAQDILAIADNKPLFLAHDQTAEAVIPFPRNQASAPLIPVTANQPVMGFVSAEKKIEKSVIAWCGQDTGNIATAHLNIYRLDRDNDRLLRVYRSDDIVANLSTTLKYIRHWPEKPLQINAGEIHAIELEVTGSGTYHVVGETAGWIPTDDEGMVPKSLGAIPSGVLQSGSATLAVTGLDDPRGMAFDLDGTLYIADTGNDRVVTFDGTTQNKLPLVGLDGPTDVAVVGDGMVFVVDSGNERLVRWRDNNQATVDLWANPDPRDVAVGAGGTVYLLDATAGTVYARSPAGDINDLGLSGLSAPRSITVGDHGTLYIADTGNDRVVTFDGTTQDAITDADLGAPTGVAFFDGLLYIANDKSGHVLMTFDGTTMSTPNTAVLLQLNFGLPTCIAVSSLGILAGVGDKVVWAPDSVTNFTDLNLNIGHVVGLAADDTAVYATTDDGSLWRFGLAGPPTQLITGAVAGSSVGGVAVAGGQVYVCDDNRHRLASYTDGAGLATVVIGPPAHPVGVGAGGTHAYASTAEGGFAILVDGAQIDYVALDDVTPGAITVRSDAVYVTDTTHNRVATWGLSIDYQSSITKYGAPAAMAVADSVLCTIDGADLYRGNTHTGLGAVIGAGIAVTAAGQVYIADTATDTIAVFGDGATDHYLNCADITWGKPIPWFSWGIKDENARPPKTYPPAVAHPDKWVDLSTTNIAIPDWCNIIYTAAVGTGGSGGGGGQDLNRGYGQGGGAGSWNTGELVRGTGASGFSTGDVLSAHVPTPPAGGKNTPVFGGAGKSGHPGTSVQIKLNSATVLSAGGGTGGAGGDNHAYDSGGFYGAAAGNQNLRYRNTTKRIAGGSTQISRGKNGHGPGGGGAGGFGGDGWSATDGGKGARGGAWAVLSQGSVF